MVAARAGAWLLVAVLGSALGGCVSEATYEQSVLDARAARTEAARRDEIQAQLHAQMLALNERLQVELSRQTQLQEQLLVQMARMHEAEGARGGAASAKGHRAAEVHALQQQVRQLEEQQRETQRRAEELQAEVTRLQGRPRVIRTTNGRAPVKIDTENPWY